MMQRSNTQVEKGKKVLKDERLQRFGCKGSNPSAFALAFKKKLNFVWCA